jgi:hypothetical protein
VMFVALTELMMEIVYLRGDILIAYDQNKKPTRQRGSVSLLLARDYASRERLCDQISSPGPGFPE